MLTGNHNKILLAALFLSISAHASGFYFFWPAAAQTTWVRPGQIQVNVVALNSKDADKKKIADNNHHPENIKSETSSINHVNERVRKLVNRDGDQKNMAESKTREYNSNTNAGNKLTVQLRGKIKTALQKHLTYPQIARRRGWQGTVTIQVTVKGNGDLQQVKIRRSSGYALLDNSAITALRKVGRLEELKSLLQGKTMPIELPIKYLLEESRYGAPSV